MTDLISEVECHTCFVDSPRDRSQKGNRARSAVHQLKRGDDTIVSSASRYIAAHLDELNLVGVFGPDITLVPVPGSKPLRSQHSLWPARTLVASMVDAGLGLTWQHLLKRASEVRKSAFAPPGRRPTAAEHFESFATVPANVPCASITLVDDVITKGATMLAAISRLRKASPDIPIRGFVLVRTRSHQPVRTNPAPALCRIRLQGNQTVREP